MGGQGTVGQGITKSKRKYSLYLDSSFATVCLNSVSAFQGTLISSKSRVYLLMDRDPVGQSASRSVGFSKWTVLIGGIRCHIFDTRPDTEFDSLGDSGFRNIPGILDTFSGIQLLFGKFVILFAFQAFIRRVHTVGITCRMLGN
jgi:hypothetical protein